MQGNYQVGVQKKIQYIIFALISLIYISIYMHLPVTILTNANYDDALYIEHAQEILRGHWLGEYNFLTLCKGSGFPLFLALSAVLGIPITLSFSLFYLLACYLFVKSLFEFGVNKYISMIIFIVLLFHPQILPSRIIRETFYVPLTLIVIAGQINLFNLKKYKNNLIYLIPYGLALGLFWITREEGVWIVPAIVILFCLKIFQLRKKLDLLKMLIRRQVFLILIGVAPILFVSFINYYKYGVFEVVDIKGSFANTMGSLQSVDVGEEIPFLPVSYKARQAIYTISPTFLELEDFFENRGKGWTVSKGCEHYPDTCGDYGGGWFLWAFRFAVADAGHYKTAQDAEVFYKSVTSEIEAACEQGVINCKKNFYSLMPSLNQSQLTKIPETFWQIVKYITFQLPDFENIAVNFPWDKQKTNSILQFLGNPRHISPETILPQTMLQGWFYSKNGSWIELECGEGKKNSRQSIGRQESPDIAIHFSDPLAHSQRFSFSFHFPDCRIVTTSSIKKTIETLLPTENLYVYFEHGEGENINFDNIIRNEPIFSREKFEFRVKNFLIKVYKIFSSIMVPLGALCYLFCLVRPVFWKNKKGFDLLCITTFLWALTCTRLALIVLVHVSSFPAINSLHLAPVFPMILSAALLSFLLPFTIKRNTNEVSR